MLLSSVLGARSLLVPLAIGLVACSGNAALRTSASDAAGGSSTGADTNAHPTGEPDAAGSESSGAPQAEPTCSATPTQLLDFNALAHDLGADPFAETSSLAVVGTSIYFVFGETPEAGGTLLSLPIRGGAYTTMIKGVTLRQVIADPVATSTAVFLNYFPDAVTNNEGILAVSPAWPAPKMLATSNGSVSGITANDSNVYFVDQDGLKSVPIAGGNAQLLSEAFSTNTASGLAVVGSSVVATTSDLTGTGAVYEVPIGGGSPTMIPTGQPGSFFPMACGSDVCWWTGPGLGETGLGFIARLSGSVVNTISAPADPLSLSFDGTSFYGTFTNAGLVRIPASGGPAVTMAAAAGYAAVAGDCVYFSVSLPVGLPSDDGGVSASGIYVVRKL
jgi:hypothetical protein